MAEPIMIERVAEHYRRDGYRVQVGPRAEGLPATLGDFRPDVLAERDGEHAVVVITTRREVAENPQLIFVAGELDRQPGWRLDVLFTGQDPVTSEPMADHDEPTHEDLDAMLRSARRLIDLGEVDAAYLVGWAVVEASLRTASRANGVPPPGGTSAAVLDAAWGNGLLSGDDYGRLSDVARVRNAVAHGWRTAEADPSDVLDLIAFATRLAEKSALPAA